MTLLFLSPIILTFFITIIKKEMHNVRDLHDVIDDYINGNYFIFTSFT